MVTCSALNCLTFSVTGYVLLVKLQHKAIFLVLIPLFFDMGLVIALSKIVHSADEEANALLAAQKLTTYSERMTRCAFEVGVTSFQIQVKYENNQHRRLLPKKAEQLRDAIENFRQLARLSPMKERYLKLADRCTSVTEIFQSAQLSKDPTIPEMISQYKRVEPRINEIAAELDAVQKEEQNILNSTAESAERFRKLANTIVILGIGTNILLATVLTRLFYRSTTKRLYQLMENTLRLESREPLLSPQAGTDEIAQLEKTFFSVGNHLQELERTKQEFIAMVSHDMRTPLNHQCGVLRLFSEGFFGEINEAGKGQLLKAERSLKRLIRMINELLDIERLDAGELKLNLCRTDITEIVEESVSQLESMAQDRQQKILNKSKSILSSLDQDRMVQVLINLISNSIKFNRAGGVVCIETEDFGREFSITISDNGRGIPKEDLQNIFDRFRQSEPSSSEAKEGYGLGLAICKALIEAHGGTISVESELGAGTAFTIMLPKLTATTIFPNLTAPLK